MASSLKLRLATTDDIPRMADIHESAFRDTILTKRCFPQSDPASRQGVISKLQKGLADPDSRIVIVEENTPSSSPVTNPIVGWARWVRKTPPHPGVSPPPVTLTPNMFPPTGDCELAVLLFQANADAARRLVGDKAHWFLSMVAVHADHQRRGAAALMMRYGVDQADERGWVAYVNAAPVAVPLYEKFGFATVEESVFEDRAPGLASYHMVRSARESVADSSGSQE